MNAIQRAFAWLVGMPEVHAKLDRILDNQEQIMSDLSDVAKEIDDETNTIAARLDRLIASQTNPADVATLKAISARLKTLGQDPDKVVPSAVPIP